MDNPEVKPPRRQMSYNEAIVIGMYLKENRSTLEGLDPDTLLTMIDKGTGISINRNNLAGLRNTDGLEWVIPRRKERRPKAQASEAILANALIDLYQELAVSPPPNLVALAGRDVHG